MGGLPSNIRFECSSVSSISRRSAIGGWRRTWPHCGQMPAGGLEEAEIQTNWLEFALRIVISSDLIQNHQQIGRCAEVP